MNAKKINRVLKEIQETTSLVDYLLAQGVDLSSFCACTNIDCPACKYNDLNFFSEKKVKEAKEWKTKNYG